MFAKIEKDNNGLITHAYYIFDPTASPGNFPGILVNDGIIDELIRQDSSAVIDSYFWDDDYPAVMPKTTNPATISGQTLSNLPIPCTVSFPELGQEYEITDGEETFVIEVPGTYAVTVKSVKYLDKSFEMVVT